MERNAPLPANPEKLGFCHGYLKSSFVYGEVFLSGYRVAPQE